MTDQQSQPQDLTALWEQMGSSTGTLLGSLIGCTAQSGLRAYEQMVINPLRQLNQSSRPAGQENISADPAQAPGIREQTWQEMGRRFGDIIGTSIGMSMDLLINSLENSTSTRVPGHNQKEQTDMHEPD